jgi:hypothetical protein
MGNVTQMQKSLFRILLGEWDEKLPWKHRQPGMERLLVGKRACGMNHQATTVFLHSILARWPFSDMADTTSAH